eukprot:CAMPEP_0197913838 /NCGR_PEP_ID=MMETSP1439-20131203/77345_1 /TAXON_ID=66791 /ORGANISM="Gonyaulax spinifera, Strain CCMP409" /LENGTH=232 /DNA_ID=CAMNT_0043535719 /DNA_START=133 /DNA_END=829 /DNA_ORIENTATION=+
MARGADDMQHVLRKVKNLEDGAAKHTKLREATLERLERVQQKLDEKEKEFQDCQHNYGQVSKGLEEKRKQREELKAEIDRCSRDMNSLVAKTLEQQRAAAYWAEELSGNHHVRELAVQRGYSCSKHGASPGQLAPGPSPPASGGGRDWAARAPQAHGAAARRAPWAPSRGWTPRPAAEGPGAEGQPGSQDDPSSAPCRLTSRLGGGGPPRSGGSLALITPCSVSAPLSARQA